MQKVLTSETPEENVAHVPYSVLLNNDGKPKAAQPEHRYRRAVIVNIEFRVIKINCT